jgi:hypothetical protein
MMQNRFPLLVLFVLSTGLALRGQTTQDEQLRTKRAAEATQLQSSSPAASDGGVPDEAARQRKKAAEAMYVVASAAAGSNRLVTGKPFAAEAVTETIQTLADGNRIVRHNITRYYRDRSGRTRREQTIETLGPSSPVAPLQIIVISDPVAKADYILDPVRQTVRKFGRLEIESGRKEGLDGSGTRDLGKETIEGLECAGTRTTVTIPAGQIGNERPIVAVTETWYAPAIEAVVRSSTSDPRFGDTSYVLRKVITTDQPRNLFEPPSAYQVEFEGPSGVMMKRQ